VGYPRARRGLVDLLQSYFVQAHPERYRSTYRRLGSDPLGLPLLGLFTLWLAPRLPRHDWIFLLAVIGSAGLNVAAPLVSTQALKLEDVLFVTPLLTFNPAFTVLIAATFLGEIPSPRSLIGVGLPLAGAYWLTPFKSLSIRPGTLLVLFAGLLWRITPIFEKLAIQHTDPESPRFAALSVDILLVLLLPVPALARGRASLNNLRPHGRESFLAGLPRVRRSLVIQPLVWGWSVM
jgi:uncharacterized membrane protein